MRCRSGALRSRSHTVWIWGDCNNWTQGRQAGKQDGFLSDLLEGVGVQHGQARAWPASGVPSDRLRSPKGRGLTMHPSCDRGPWMYRLLMTHMECAAFTAVQVNVVSCLARLQINLASRPRPRLSIPCCLQTQGCTCQISDRLPSRSP